MRRQTYRWGKIWIPAVLCPALALQMAACGQSGSGEGSGSAAQESRTGGEKTQEVVFHPPADTPFVTPGEKEEIVYVKADASGAPVEKTVEVTLGEIEGEDPIEDRSDLKEIKNTEGDEEYSEAGEGRYLWQNKGEDIHYKGKSDQPLPLEVRVTYYLEGQQVTAQQIAGKTGKVKIRFDYENKTEVPFMVLSAALLPSDVFSDVEVDGGRVLDLSDQKAVIGFAFPGLADSLRLSDYEPTEELDLPEYVEIEARAEAFELDFTATVVSTGLFEDLEEEDLEDLEQVSDDMEELTDASEEILDAAQELADGGNEFEDYLSQYFDGIAELSEGTSELEQGLAALSQNIAQIGAGSQSLQSGLEQIGQSLSGIDLSKLSSKESGEASAAAMEALRKLGESSAALGEKCTNISANLETLQTFAQETENYISQVQALQKAVADHPAPDLAAMDLEMGWTQALNDSASEQAKEKAQAAAQKAASEAIGQAADNAAKATAEAAKSAAEEKIGESAALDGLGLSDAEKAVVKEQLIREVKEAIGTDTGEKPEVTVSSEDVEICLDAVFGEIRDQIQKDGEGRSSVLMEASSKITEPALPDTDAFSAGEMQQIAQIIGSMEKSLAVIGAYGEGMSTLTSSLSNLSDALTKLREGISQLSDGSAELTKGLGLFEEALALAAQGSSQLSGAMETAASAGGELGGACRKLVEGMEEFADGIAEFDEEGIQSLAELAGPQYRDVIRGIRAARDAEKNYTNFSGLCDGQKGSVKFIIETEEIRKEE